MRAFVLKINTFQWQPPLVNKIKLGLLLLAFLSLVTGLIVYKVILIGNLSFLSSFWAFYGIITTFFLISRIPYAYLYEDRHDISYPKAKYPNVSIVIAAKNEEKSIFRTISTCINSRYPKKIECIVVDDGSTDKTKDEIIKAQNFYGNKIKLISFLENRGKREAMAAGINKARNNIIIFVDSDTFLTSSALLHITQHFLADKKIGAVSGNVKAENANTNLLTKMQSIQYAISFSMYKAPESVHRSVTCCPGCFSAYRKKAIKPLLEEWKEHKFLETKATFGDDRGLTNFVLKNWDIIFCEKAKATTVVPEKFSTYWYQQLRWKKSWIREGLHASTFMWKKRHPLASSAFYINFSFPIAGPLLAGNVLVSSFLSHNPFLFIIFIFGFILLGIVFSMFVRLYRKEKNWTYIPLFSFLFISLFIWQMPYALFTLRNTKWGTR